MNDELYLLPNYSGSYVQNLNFNIIVSNSMKTVTQAATSIVVNDQS